MTRTEKSVGSVDARTRMTERAGANFTALLSRLPTARGSRLTSAEMGTALPHTRSKVRSRISANGR